MSEIGKYLTDPDSWHLIDEGIGAEFKYATPEERERLFNEAFPNVKIYFLDRNGLWGNTG